VLIGQPKFTRGCYALSCWVFTGSGRRCRSDAEFSETSQPILRAGHGAFHRAAGISLTVEYGPDHLPCKFLIAPTKPFDPSDPVGSFSTIPSSTVAEILDEIAPRSTRSKETPGSGMASGCMNERKVLTMTPR
jgi:hypothetical protein